MTEEALSFETKQSPWWLHLMAGIFNLIIGFLLLTSPGKTVFALVVALGIYWVVNGIFVLVGMFVDRSAWGWKLFVGIISILAGMTILRYPLISTLSLPGIIILIMGIQGLISGIVISRAKLPRYSVSTEDVTGCSPSVAPISVCRPACCNWVANLAP